LFERKSVASSAGRVGAGLRRRERAAIIVRSFLLQSVWNRRTMQSVGFCYAMLPVLRRKGADAAARKAFLERHLGFFNTNPVLASYVLGAAAAAELRSDTRWATEVPELKRALSSPLGMAGDALFWAALRPLAAFLGVLAALAAKPWAAILFLVVYNVPHVFVRVRGVVAGAERGPEAVKEVLGPAVKRTVVVLRAASSFSAGLVVALSLAQGRLEPAALLVAGGLFGAGMLALRLRVPLSVVAACAVALGAALTVTGSFGG
jgi:mannose/fructose/N-acetylgalactosamine-specific phosphotransferase system component IID